MQPHIFCSIGVCIINALIRVFMHVHEKMTACEHVYLCVQGDVDAFQEVM